MKLSQGAPNPTDNRGRERSRTILGTTDKIMPPFAESSIPTVQSGEQCDHLESVAKKMEELPPRFVSFTNTTKVFFVENALDMTKSERDELWYNDGDLTKTKMDMRRTVLALRKGREADDCHCARGLEHLTSPEYLENRKQNKAEVVKAVLEEQSLQKAEGRINENALADASEICSQWARELAQSSGLADADEVRRMEDEEDEEDAESIDITDSAWRGKVTESCHSILDKALQILNSSDSSGLLLEGESPRASAIFSRLSWNVPRPEQDSLIDVPLDGTDLQPSSCALSEVDSEKSLSSWANSSFTASTQSGMMSLRRLLVRAESC